MIENEMVAQLPKQGRGFLFAVPVVEIVNATPREFKTGVHWVMLPVGSLFSEKALGWWLIHQHFCKWRLSTAGMSCWTQLLERIGREIDISNVDRYGSHTQALSEGTCMYCQGRKKQGTTNTLPLLKEFDTTTEN